MASTGKKPSKKKKPVRKRIPLPGVRFILWISAFGITFAGLVAILLLPHKETDTVIISGQNDMSESVAETARLKPGKTPIVQEKPKPFVYEEKIGADFDLRVWEADMAIIQTLALMGHGEERMVHKKVEPRFFYGTPYHYQEIVIYTVSACDEFISKLKNSLERFLSNASLVPTERDNVWAININGRQTHLISVKKILRQPLPGTGRLVIVIDDLGASPEYARSLSRLDFPVIFSILPHMSDTAEVVRIARESGLEIMLHLPMEPNTFSQGVNPGKGALFVNMDSSEIRRRVINNLAQVPGAVGVNNHMGSRFTQDYQGMSIVFEEIRKRGLFFLDSLTTPKSVAEKLAREKNVDFIKRHVFLDNVQDKDAILFQLSKAENIAIRYGKAVAIGHPYPETLQALRLWSRLRNSRVEVVRISELIATGKYRTALQDPEAAN